MKNCTTCDIVMELLPLYCEQQTGEESNEYIKEHLKVCPSCKGVYDLMNAEIWETRKTTDGQKHHDKKPKRRLLSPREKRWLLLAAGLLGYLCLMGGLVVFTFFYLVY